MQYNLVLGCTVFVKRKSLFVSPNNTLSIVVKSALADTSDPNSFSVDLASFNSIAGKFKIT